VKRKNFNTAFLGSRVVESLSRQRSFSLAVELPGELNPLKGNGVDIIAISACPETLKDDPAVAILRQACNGKLSQKLVIVPTSGNFGTSVLRHAHQYGIERVIAVILTDLAPKKKELLEFHGAEIISVPGGTIARAEKEARETGGILLNQYTDMNNWKAHEKYSGPQVWAQTSGKISLFASVMGSTGTLIGVSKFLKKKNPNVKTLGVMLQEGEEVPGARSLSRIQKDVSLPWEEAADCFVEVCARDSYRHSFALGRLAHISAGPSSGSVFCGLLQFLVLEEKAGRLEKLRNQHGRLVAAFMCPDGPEPYLEKYFTFLTASEFAYAMA
jgi:cysteine synthase